MKEEGKKLSHFSAPGVCIFRIYDFEYISSGDRMLRRGVEMKLKISISQQYTFVYFLCSESIKNLFFSFFFLSFSLPSSFSYDVEVLSIADHLDNQRRGTSTDGLYMLIFINFL